MNTETAEKLYEVLFMKVFSYVMTLCGNRDDAMEITQEAFFRAISTDKAFKGESEEFTWLCSIAKNIFIDEKRRKAKFTEEVTEEKPDPKKDIESRLVDSETSMRIHKILHTLDEPYKEVFQLRTFGELSFKQIGTVFGKTENWARVTYHRARLKITERMNENEV